MQAKLDLDRVIGQAAAFARESQYAEASIGLQVTQVILLSKIANMPEIERAVVNYWTTFISRQV